MYQSVQNPLSLKKEQQNSEIISHLITNACHFLYIVVEQMLYLYSLFFCFVTFYRQNKTKNNKNTTPSAQVQTLIGKSYSNRIDISKGRNCKPSGVHPRCLVWFVLLNL
jgi:hypothetical protein